MTAAGSGAVIVSMSLMGTPCGAIQCSAEAMRRGASHQPPTNRHLTALWRRSPHFLNRRLRSPPPARQVAVALHLRQARDRAPELEGAVAVGVKLLRRRGGGADEIAMRLVERVDEDVEAPGLVAPLRPEPGDAFDDEAVEGLAQRQIVGGAVRLAAESGEVEPGDVLGGARHNDEATLHHLCLARRRGVAGEVGACALLSALVAFVVRLATALADGS